MKKALSSLRAKHLKHLVFLTGCSAGTTKHDLTQRLLSHLPKPLINQKVPRILSVDMGIRNLAFCVIEPRSGDHHSQISRSTLDLSVSTWQKVDLLAHIRNTLTTGVSETAIVEADAGDSQDEIEKDLFNPSTISKVAYQLTRTLLAYNPTIILIERQRFRTAGGSAIQEWTLRVNMLESMLWACLRTMKQLDQSGNLGTLELHDIVPVRVAKFWVGSRSGRIGPESDMLNADAALPDTTASDTKKLDRQKVLREWLGDAEQTNVHLHFTDEAADAAGMFDKKSSGRGRSGSAKVNGKTKLDDLTDCLLQGVAWFQWEVNRQSILSMIQDRCDSTG